MKPVIAITIRAALTRTKQGPIAVPASKVDKVLRVQTHVNGELRQNATTEDLIFSIPYLIKTMSEGQTLMPGDVLATGTVSTPRRRLVQFQELIISNLNSLLALVSASSLPST